MAPCPGLRPSLPTTDPEGPSQETSQTIPEAVSQETPTKLAVYERNLKCEGNAGKQELGVTFHSIPKHLETTEIFKGYFSSAPWTTLEN